MKKNLFVSTFKPLCIATLVILGGYSSIASASLSTKPATPNQIIASKAERLSNS